jgi:hypothetical protein
MIDQTTNVLEPKTQTAIPTRPPVPPFTHEHGLMQRRFACINDLPIKESERKFHWPLGRRPDAHPGLSDLGL